MKKFTSISLIFMIIFSNFTYGVTAAVTEGVKNDVLNSEYVVIVNTSSKENQSTGKIVFDENITEEEIEKSVALAKKYDFEIVLQPRMLDDKMTVSSKFLMSVFEKFVKLYKNTRLIPQVHKFINVE